MNERKEPLRSLAAGMQSRVSGKLGDIWWAFMLRGVFAGVLGTFALIWPTLSFTILTPVAREPSGHHGQNRLRAKGPIHGARHQNGGALFVRKDPRASL